MKSINKILKLYSIRKNLYIALSNSKNPKKYVMDFEERQRVYELYRYCRFDKYDRKYTIKALKYDIAELRRKLKLKMAK